MRRSHVEERSRRYAARQYVSETHDHKPDAPARREDLTQQDTFLAPSEKPEEQP